MSTYRYIYRRPDISKPNRFNKQGEEFVNIHYLVGYNAGTISDYTQMAKEMRKSIPNIILSKVECNHVTKSSYCHGFTLARYDGFIRLKKKDIERLIKEGWQIVDRCEYYFF